MNVFLCEPLRSLHLRLCAADARAHCGGDAALDGVVGAGYLVDEEGPSEVMKRLRRRSEESCSLSLSLSLSQRKRLQRLGDARSFAAAQLHG